LLVERELKGTADVEVVSQFLAYSFQRSRVAVNQIAWPLVPALQVRACTKSIE
jgi:hypothetical protein